MTRTGRERATVSCGSAVGVNRAIVRVLNVYTHRFFSSSFFHTLGGAHVVASTRPWHWPRPTRDSYFACCHIRRQVCFGVLHDEFSPASRGR